MSTKTGGIYENIKIIIIPSMMQKKLAIDWCCFHYLCNWIHRQFVFWCVIVCSMRSKTQHHESDDWMMVALTMPLRHKYIPERACDTQTLKAYANAIKAPELSRDWGCLIMCRFVHPLSASVRVHVCIWVFTSIYNDHREVVTNTKCRQTVPKSIWDI